ncbi:MULTISPECIES: BrnT family toxin [unclassified Mesorhizobium]|uniref:BrnT family toxin n=1 Tax=unclassified Mesorhizobium TaxID=325217 RepID=UPI0024175653|nr:MULTISPECIES: BrnT family toxin [unclassified Mesorhizobium]MDG4901261.1 BrnT family toxin [Mesorhizobium sp. WSM4962]MDG4916500.1 BrnT family toxin [Mesorhizobium sp. WSM4989]
MLFEWDAAKAKINKAKHGIDFELAPEFDFANAVVDDSTVYGEERLVATGIIGLSVCVMVYVERGETIRVISLRRATKNKIESYVENL